MNRCCAFRQSFLNPGKSTPTGIEGRKQDQRRVSLPGAIALILCIAMAASVQAAPPRGNRAATQFDLATATIADINAAFDAGALSSEKLVGMYLKRIEAYDKKGPRINSVLFLNEKVLAEARMLDAERKSKGPRSPLHGIPVVIKDLVDVAGFPTTAGFKPFGAPVPIRDATVTAKLKQAGAIVLAKINTANWFGNKSIRRESSHWCDAESVQLGALTGWLFERYWRSHRFSVRNSRHWHGYGRFGADSILVQ